MLVSTHHYIVHLITQGFAIKTGAVSWYSQPKPDCCIPSFQHIEQQWHCVSYQHRSALISSLVQHRSTFWFRFLEVLVCRIVCQCVRLTCIRCSKDGPPDPEASYNIDRRSMDIWRSVFGTPDATQTHTWTDDPAHQDFEEPDPECWIPACWSMLIDFDRKRNVTLYHSR